MTPKVDEWPGNGAASPTGTRHGCAAAGAGSSRARFRPEIEGLRALAALLVVVYHVWIGRVSGGVDVFFVLTGFLALGQLLRATERGGIDLLAHWGRTLRRLVPAAAVVLVGTVAACLLVLPQTRWSQTIVEVVASASFMENWKLAADSVDYYASHDTASVVQHFWSLSIQGQFAVLFPLMLLGAIALGRRCGWTSRRAIAGAVALAAALSFAFSVWLTAADQQLAYFHSLTRVWEFMLGALLALVIDRITLPLAARVVVGWVGVVGLVACGLVLDVEGGFPGYLAAWPVACAMAVLVAGTTGRRLAADRTLNAPLMQYLGRVSFPLYLWHWPVLLVTLHLAGREEPGLLLGVVIIAVSLALAVATGRWVEEPVQRFSGGRGGRSREYRVAALFLAPVLVAALCWQGLATTQGRTVGAVGDPDHPGAAVHMAGYVERGLPDAEPLPPAVRAAEDWVYYQDMGDGCSEVPTHPDLSLCSVVPQPRPDAPTVAVVGDSNMSQFLGAVIPVARERGWRLEALLKSSCPFSTVSELAPHDEGCVRWNQLAIDYLATTTPDAVVAQATLDVHAGLTERSTPEMVEAWDRLSDAGIPMLAVRGTPRFDEAPATCSDRNGRDSPACDVPRTAFYPSDPPVLLDTPSSVSVLDLADLVCEPAVCRPEVGRVSVYLDERHLTATFAASLAPVVSPALEELLS
ncbi:acyltransferase [Actinomycetospora sp. NBRC 106375]|uniref:acyltransferase family protein n=1 Tax=Actinomycetospora sp. NBRC 106375 TaxID=3032207 RepID=UPI0024A58286|nr:acyltransferase family protein [Actinomycetospora sp. NBRC 106375]GLZ46582.1 acyltransferase [Actinomycetospora sp. NBRC 106375]